MGQADKLTEELVDDNASSIEDSTSEETKHEGSIPLGTHIKLRKRAQDAEARAEQFERELEASKQEKNLLTMAIGKPKDEAELLPPREEDYYGEPEKWTAAYREYNTQYKTKLKAELQESTAQQIAQNNQLAIDNSAANAAATKRSTALAAHHARADKLNAPDYLDREQRVIDSMGQELFDKMVENYDNSDELVFTLGADTPDMQSKRDEINNNFLTPWSGVTKLDKYAASIGKTKTDDHLPEPDKLKVGGAVSNAVDKQLIALRAAIVLGKDRDAMNKLMAFKREHNIK